MRDPWAGQEKPGFGVLLNERHTVLAGKPYLRQQDVVFLLPCAHVNCAILQNNQGRQVGLKLAQNNTVFYKAVMAAGVQRWVIAVFKRAVLALKTRSEGSDGSLGQRRADHAKPHQRRDGVKPVWPRHPAGAHRGRRAV